MTRLIYHAPLGEAGHSPFDEAVLEVARSGPISIVSPYIGVDYLQRILQVSGGWRLISDIEAWLSSLSIRARPKAWLFIRENINSIHHCPSIHAKAVIGSHLAMFGSANLTTPGILGRTEMGILIDNHEMVAELGQWFETLWEQTHPPIANETSAFIQWLDEEAERSPIRRERFSLSATSKKIRASLVKLSLPEHPKTSVTQDTQLNLEEVAQTLVIKDDKHYASLEEAVESAINTLADEGFVFKRIVQDVEQTYPTSTIREIYFAVLQHCANHVRSVFAENTRNRLILTDGKFRQSTRDIISEALVPFDKFLKQLVHHFEFDNDMDVPNEDAFEILTGIRGADQVILISELLECGFLEINDIAGKLPQYKLSEDFEWDGRFKLFAGAMHDWQAKKEHRAVAGQTLLKMETEEDDDDFSGGYSISEMPEEFSSEDIHEWSEPRNMVRANSEIERIQKERHEKIDRVLSLLLSQLIAGKTLASNKDFARTISEKLGIGYPLVWRIVSCKEKAMPRLFIHSKGNLVLNPGISWGSLKNYPKTKELCKTFLEAD